MSLTQRSNKQQGLQCPSIPADAGAHVSHHPVKNVRNKSLLAIFSLSFFLMPFAFAQDWGSLATVSSTMGVQEGRLCLGESSRGDLGCPTYAPYVSATTGSMGIGTLTPEKRIHIKADNSFAGIMLERTTNSNAGPVFVFRKTRDGAPALAGDGLGHIFLSNVIDTEGSIRDSWFIGAFATESHTPSGTGHNLVFRTTANGQFVGSERMRITENGHLGLGIITPTTTLHMAGSLRLGTETSTTLQTCDTNRTGAIKYQSGDFHYCRNGTTWESLTSLTGGGGSAGDRIISGTAAVITQSNGGTVSFTLAGTAGRAYMHSALGFVGPGVSTTGPVSGSEGYFASKLLVGAPSPTGYDITLLKMTNTNTVTDNANIYIKSANRNAHIDFDARNTAGSSLVFRSNETELGRIMYSNGFNALQLWVSATEQVRIVSSGNVGIGTTSPNAKLEVAGTASATTLQLADNPSDACTPASYGRIKVINGRQYTCRP